MIKTDKSIIYQSSLFLSRFYPPLSVSICVKYLFLFLINTGVKLTSVRAQNDCLRNSQNDTEKRSLCEIIPWIILNKRLIRLLQKHARSQRSCCATTSALTACGFLHKSQNCKLVEYIDVLKSFPSERVGRWDIFQNNFTSFDLTVFFFHSLTKF